uniref:Uncharacterized protein n=1 Tax=Anopheles dirus TaxID=7168 RepID=A0A182NYX2_9DIPT
MLLRSFAQTRCTARRHSRTSRYAGHIPGAA